MGKKKGPGKRAKDVAIPGSAQAEEVGVRHRTKDEESALRLAQCVNLHLAGVSLTEIGQQIGMTADEVDRMFSQDAARYVRSQPQLRVFVRNWVSNKYMQLLDADMGEALAMPTTDEDGALVAVDVGSKMAHQDRVIRILEGMRKLHGTDAPTQTEVKIEAAPEAVDALVTQLSAMRGYGYDIDVFNDEDVVDAELVEEAREQSTEALEAASVAVEEGDSEPL